MLPQGKRRVIRGLQARSPPSLTSRSKPSRPWWCAPPSPAAAPPRCPCPPAPRTSAPPLGRALRAAPRRRQPAGARHTAPSGHPSQWRGGAARGHHGKCSPAPRGSRAAGGALLSSRGPRLNSGFALNLRGFYVCRGVFNPKGASDWVEIVMDGTRISDFGGIVSSLLFSDTGVNTTRPWKAMKNELFFKLFAISCHLLISGMRFSVAAALVRAPPCCSAWWGRPGWREAPRCARWPAGRLQAASPTQLHRPLCQACVSWRRAYSQLQRPQQYRSVNRQQPAVTPVLAAEAHAARFAAATDEVPCLLPLLSWHGTRPLTNLSAFDPVPIRWRIHIYLYNQSQLSAFVTAPSRCSTLAGVWSKKKPYPVLGRDCNHWGLHQVAVQPHKCSRVRWFLWVTFLCTIWDTDLYGSLTPH